MFFCLSSHHDRKCLVSYLLPTGSPINEEKRPQFDSIHSFLVFFDSLSDLKTELLSKYEVCSHAPLGESHKTETLRKNMCNCVCLLLLSIFNHRFSSCKHFKVHKTLTIKTWGRFELLISVLCLLGQSNLKCVCMSTLIKEQSRLMLD